MSEELAATEPGVTSRRTLLMGVSVVGATAVLAGCGTDDSNGDATGTGGAADPTAPAGDGGGGGTKIASASEIPVGGGVIFAGQGVVVTQPVAGTFKGFSNICTHQSCPLSNVDGGTINCTCHGSKFSIEDGTPKNGPATKSLAAKNVTKSGEDIVLA